MSICALSLELCFIILGTKRERERKKEREALFAFVPSDDDVNDAGVARTHTHT